MYLQVNLSDLKSSERLRSRHMATPQVTITLGRSGQKVVKESWGNSDGGRANAPAPSGNKRSLTESFGSSADHAFGHNKRMREDVTARSYGYSGNTDESRIGSKDLRLKLLRKGISRRLELENERKTKELHEKVSRAIRSFESPDQGLLGNVPFYTSQSSNGVRSRSEYPLVKSSGGISTPRSSTDKLTRVPLMMPVDASRTGHVPLSGHLDSSRRKVPNPTTSRRPLNSDKLITGLAPPTGGISRSPYTDGQPLTVNSLLHSLGLVKYSINFQAEEIDMVALKQMGDRDLKELGIPLGPRKKILLALQARTRQPVIQTHGNYLR